MHRRGCVEDLAWQIYNSRLEAVRRGWPTVGTMLLTINGQQRQIDDGTSVAQLLDELNAAHQRLAVEVNRELVGHKFYAETVLHAGDVVEVVTFVGGG